ncbi:CBS domain-containing protein [Candidatus Neomarinimicrobiota bacterium]
MRFVRDIINAKGSDAWSVTSDTTVYDAIKLMADKDIGALLVLSGKKVEGIFTERDYARKVILEGKASEKLPVKTIMTARVTYITMENTLDECMAVMTEKRVRHLPVMDNDHLAGIISIGDVVKAIISGQEYEIKQLEHYVEGLLYGRA